MTGDRGNSTQWRTLSRTRSHLFSLLVGVDRLGDLGFELLDARLVGGRRARARGRCGRRGRGGGRGRRRSGRSRRRRLGSQRLGRTCAVATGNSMSQIACCKALMKRTAVLGLANCFLCFSKRCRPEVTDFSHDDGLRVSPASSCATLFLSVFVSCDSAPPGTKETPSSASDALRSRLTAQAEIRESETERTMRQRKTMLTFVVVRVNQLELHTPSAN